MTKNNYGQNMLILTSFWGEKNTLKMMPVTQDCPYAEVIYDPTTTLLVVISKIKKDNFQFIPKLDEDGEVVKAKRPKQNGKMHKEQRTLMPVLQEYYISEYDEQIAFIKQFGVNVDSFPVDKFVRHMDSEPTIMAPEKTPLLDGKGMAIKKPKK